MFNIKLEQKSYKMKFKDLPAKIQQSKTNMGEERGGGAQSSTYLWIYTVSENHKFPVKWRHSVFSVIIRKDNIAIF